MTVLAWAFILWIDPSFPGMVVSATKAQCEIGRELNRNAAKSACFKTNRKPS